MAQIPKQVSALLPARVRDFLQGNSGRELVAGITDSLLLFGDQLYLCSSGASTPIADPDSAESLAKAARQLLTGVDPDNSVELLLPSREFVATTQELPGVSSDNLQSALYLQQDSLLPACEKDLVMAVNPLSADLGDVHIVLWIEQARLDSLFTAFASEGLFLAAVKPRQLALTVPDKETRLLEQGENCLTAVAISNGVVMQWLQVDRTELDQPEFAEQWSEELKSRPATRTIEIQSAEDYFNRTDKNSHTEYGFHPAGALEARKKVQQGRKLIAAAAAVVCIGIVSAIPFILQSLEFRRVAADLESQREMSAPARANQAVVVNFENEWGPISDFPVQNIRETMFTLQEALLPDQLSSLEISEGVISIQGTSEDPQAILQRLEQDPMFTDVVFARATNNARYYIDLRLSSINFEGYMLRYFPDE